jgi:hypothetical protein
MAESGLLTEVKWEWDGTEATAASLTGTDTVSVLDPGTLTDNDIVWIDDAQYDVTSVTGSVVEFSPVLAEDVDEGDPIIPDAGGQPGKIWLAVVIVPDTDRPIEVIMTGYDLLALPEGEYDPPQPIVLADDLASIIDPTPGFYPSVSIESIPVDDLPDPEAPVDPPAVSPPITTTGMVDAIVLTSGNTDAASTEINYHMSTVDGFTPDATTLLPGSPTRQTVFTVTTLPDGAPLLLDTTYYFRTVAANVVGEATPGAQVEGALDPNTASEVTAAILRSGEAEFGRIEVGSDGYWDPDEGIVVTQNDGSQTIISTLPDVASQFAGKVIASFLTLLEGIITGLLTVLGVIQLSKGVTRPRTAATAIDYWPAVELDYAATGNTTSGRYGLCDSLDGTLWLTVNGGDEVVEAYDKATGALVDADYLDNAYPAAEYVRNVRSITRIDNDLYLLGSEWNGTANEFRIHRFDATTLLREDFEDTGIAITSAAGDAALGVEYDTTDVLLFGYSLSSGFVRVRRYDATTLDFINFGSFEFPDPIDVRSIIAGTLDFGAFRNLIARKAGGLARVFTNAGVRDEAREFDRAYANEVWGMYWDGSQFYSLNNTGKVFEYNTNTATATVEINYAWVSEDDSKFTEESTVPLTRTWKKRSQIAITTPPPPEAALTGADKANQVAVYVQVDAGTLDLQQIISAAPWEYKFAAWVDDVSPVGSNGFASVAAPGSFESEEVLASDSNPLIQFLGDGSFMLTGVNFYDSGELATNSTWGPGYFRFKRIGTIIFVEGYTDRDADFGTTATTIGGVTIPAWAVPSVNRQVNQLPGYSSNEEFRYTFNTDGTVDVQRTGVITSFMKVSAHYDL